MSISEDDSAVLHAIFAAAKDAIIVSDAQGTITRANSKAATMFGYKISEMVGQNIDALVPEPHRPFSDTLMIQSQTTALDQTTEPQQDMEGLRKDASVFPVQVSAGRSPIAGRPLLVSIWHDLTNRKMINEALARSQRLDAIGQMTGGISHDFNNLLTVIVGNLELLEMRSASEKQLPLINDALEAAELGAELTSRLMVFARKSNLKPEIADLRELCVGALALLQRTMGATYNIKTEFAQTLDMVMVDPVQLQSALMNLALNARDAMGASGELLVAVENVSIDDTYMAQETDIEPGDYVRLSVSDNGAGMSPEAQQRAFEPFYTTKSESGGTGFGLAMVYGFVRQSGGHVTLYSELGLGTSFGLYFPSMRQTSELGIPEDHPAPITTRLPGKGETILVVEDNPKVRRLSLKRIRDLGFNVMEAETGDQAYQMLKDGAQVDLVFSDLVMPGSLNGYDLAAKIEQEFQPLRMLLTSGYASDVVTSTMAKTQRYDVLHKPYRQAELAKRLQALLSDARKP